jgi:hypothetical protein
MSYPSLAPTGRQFDAGDYPVKTIRSQSGVESRILYGNRRTNMALQLSYDNITDAQAQQFVTHYDQTKGTFLSFRLPDGVRAGWSANAATLDAVQGNNWRYESAPSITSVRPGKSSVQVKLLGVLELN